MKKLLFAIFVGLVAVPTFAQGTPPDFSGKWTLDVAKSDFGPAPPPESMTLVIEHADPKIKVASTQKGQMGEVTNERSLTTDGKENTNKIKTMMGDQDVKSTTKWNGSKLVTTYTLDMQGMSLDVSETWELTEAGKVLAMTREIKTPQGDFAMKNVFNKQ